MDGIEKRRARLVLGGVGLAVLVAVFLATFTPEAAVPRGRTLPATGSQETPAFTGVGDHEATWRIHVTAVDQALERRDVTAAVRAWHDAYGAALGSRQWQAMVEVGDAFRRIGDVSGSREGAKPNARQAYLHAFMRARGDRSIDGVRRAAQAFADLGDEEVARQCARGAEAMEGR